VVLVNSGLLSFSLAVLGLVLGSFLNVVIARTPQGESIVRPRSRCPKCGHVLAWYENVPLLSWLVLRARCRACSAPISARYPLIELLTALLFAACGQRFGWDWSLLRALLMVGFLVPLAFIDLEHWVLPFSLTVPGAMAGLVSAVPLGKAVLLESVVGAGGAFLFFWGLEVLLRLVLRREALGAGDKWLMLLVGAFLGFRPLFGVLLLSNLQGALVGGALLLVHGRAGPAAPAPGAPAADDDWAPGPTHLPFGPWIALAALELLLLGPWLAATFPGPFMGLLTGQPLEAS
jgi:leader peptidase (prepilin peptidase)/N-methyltransferase